MTLLALDRVSVDYGGAAAVHDVSLDVAAGECVALVGESGSGKSTIALAALDLLPIGARLRGKMLIDGQPFVPSDRGTRIALVFQDPASALNPALTIGRQIGEMIPPIGRKKRVAELMARVGLDLPPSRYPHELSGGQRQRAAIAIALAGDPGIIIADEPTAALDPASRATIAALLSSLVRDAGKGLLLITHDLALAGRLATRLAVLDRGQIVEQGATPDRLAAPSSSALRSLVAAAAPRTGPPPLSTTTEQVLVLDRVRRVYRAGWRGARTIALDDVSLHIAPGETLGLIGASGAGKSTLARVALGLERPDAGTVTIGGLSPFAARRSERRAVRLMAQAVFQDPATSFDPRHLVGRIVGEPLRLVDPPADAARQVAAALEEVGLDPAMARRSPATLSGGQRQRVALARALILGPRLVVLDEALSALDMRTRAEMIDLLARLRAAHGIAYLLISHDPDVVAALAHRVVELRDGRLIG